ncbi:unnamed protein product [Vitrella brassicaformis CCMP3155]|uniref:Uncharacterized protein n=2 Tax=Vitrella brassicaformis TaxID=1169539 RepID=A0A0G4EKX8_VITBC|nr:unnamed protein product [Vitrella brassicaformis CCMP3155]|eukprot:CEL97634.1 unnamed protein product [Vitrella brassicaformis CCMP3155]
MMASHTQPTSAGPPLRTAKLNVDNRIYHLTELPGGAGASAKVWRGSAGYDYPSAAFKLFPSGQNEAVNPKAVREARMLKHARNILKDGGRPRFFPFVELVYDEPIRGRLVEEGKKDEHVDVVVMELLDTGRGAYMAVKGHHKKYSFPKIVEKCRLLTNPTPTPNTKKQGPPQIIRHDILTDLRQILGSAKLTAVGYREAQRTYQLLLCDHAAADTFFHHRSLEEAIHGCTSPRGQDAPLRVPKFVDMADVLETRERAFDRSSFLSGRNAVFVSFTAADRAAADQSVAGKPLEESPEESVFYVQHAVKEGDMEEMLGGREDDQTKIREDHTKIRELLKTNIDRWNGLGLVPDDRSGMFVDAGWVGRFHCSVSIREQMLGNSLARWTFDKKTPQNESPEDREQRELREAKMKLLQWDQTLKEIFDERGFPREKPGSESFNDLRECEGVDGLEWVKPVALLLARLCRKGLAWSPLDRGSLDELIEGLDLGLKLIEQLTADEAASPSSSSRGPPPPPLHQPPSHPPVASEEVEDAAGEVRDGVAAGRGVAGAHGAAPPSGPVPQVADTSTLAAADRSATPSGATHEDGQQQAAPSALSTRPPASASPPQPPTEPSVSPSALLDPSAPAAAHASSGGGWSGDSVFAPPAVDEAVPSHAHMPPMPFPFPITNGAAEADQQQVASPWAFPSHRLDAASEASAAVGAGQLSGGVGVGDQHWLAGNMYRVEWGPSGFGVGADDGDVAAPPCAQAAPLFAFPGAPVADGASLSADGQQAVEGFPTAPIMSPIDATLSEMAPPLAPSAAVGNRSSPLPSNAHPMHLLPAHEAPLASFGEPAAAAASVRGHPALGSGMMRGMVDSERSREVGGAAASDSDPW